MPLKMGAMPSIRPYLARPAAIMALSWGQIDPL